jgi:hypothetical protein
MYYPESFYFLVRFVNLAAKSEILFQRLTNLNARFVDAEYDNDHIGTAPP